MSALLALLFLLKLDAKLARHRHHQTGGGGLKGVEQVALAVGRGLAEQEIRLADKVLCEGAQKLQNGAQAANSLRIVVSEGFQTCVH